MADLVPLWKTPTRAQAIEILRACRASTDSMIAALAPAQRMVPSALGDGTWSVKDLLGHLATWEERALIVMGAIAAPLGEPGGETVEEFNARQLARRRGWSLADVEQDYDRTRTALVDAIDAMDDERWLAKIPAGGGRSALALVVAKLLTGGKFGFFAHDLAHRADLQTAVEQLSAP